MKKVGLFMLAVFFLPFLTTAGASVEVSLLSSADGTFVKNTEDPITETRTFPGKSGPAKIIVYNGGTQGDLGKKVSSAIISVNGKIVISPAAFNQKVSKIEKTINLVEGSNSLKVQLNGKPGGKIRVNIFQEVDAEGAGFVGKGGGIIKVDSPSSSLYGVRVEVPAGILAENSFISIKIPNEHLNSPYNGIAISDQIEISCNSSLNGFVKVVLPIMVLSSVENNIVITFFDQTTNKFGLLPYSEIDEQNKSISFYTNHFTIFGAELIEIISLYLIPSESFSDFNMRTDCFNEFFINNGNFNKYNINYKYNPQIYTHGICSGLANFAIWNYLNYGHGLRCQYNEQHSAEIAIAAFDEVYWRGWLPFLTDPLIQFNAIAAKEILLTNLLVAKSPVVLNMKNLSGGHSVVVS